jgi:hypothetical protein
LTLSVFVLVNAVPANTQSPTASADYVPTLTFDVASIKESAPSDSFIVSGINRTYSKCGYVQFGDDSPGARISSE